MSEVYCNFLTRSGLKYPANHGSGQVVLGQEFRSPLPRDGFWKSLRTQGISEGVACLLGVVIAALIVGLLVLAAYLA